MNLREAVECARRMSGAEEVSFAVQPLLMVDNSDISPTRLTVR